MDEVIEIALTKYVLGALGVIVILNLLCRVIFKFQGTGITIAIAGATALFVTAWFAKSIKRVPNPKEFSRFYLLYGGGLALLFILQILLSSFVAFATSAGIFILLIHYVTYLIFARMIFTQDKVAAFLKQS